jgi:hypothetical protein
MPIDKVLDSYIKLRFKRQPLDSRPGFNYGFEVQSKHLELIINVIADMENVLGRKLRILEIGASQGFFTLALSKMGHLVTSIEWERENYKFMKLLQETHHELGTANIQFLEVEELYSISEEKFDLALVVGTLDHVYRCLNIDKQAVFSDFIRTNSRAAIWEIPVFEQNAHWNWSLPENKFDLLERYSYLKELTWLRSHCRGAFRPLIFGSDELIFSNNQLKQFKSEDIFQKHQYVDNNTLLRKTFKVENSIIKTEIHPQNMADSSEIFLESKFLISWSQKSDFELSFPRIIKLEKGVFISQFERDSIPGRRLDEAISSSNAHQILERFLSLASKLAKSGVFPNDLRPWNILWDERDCHLIDFSSTDYFDRDVLLGPQVISFLATADFIESAKFGNPTWRIEEIMEHLGEQEFVYSELSELIFDFAWREIIGDYDFLVQLPYQDFNSALVMVLAEIKRVWSLKTNATNV